MIAPLARGGMAEVYVVVREGRETPSVLKRLLPELEHHPTAALRFRREAELATRLQHERIARTLRTATEDGRPCIEMELVPGHTVEEMMLELARHGRLPPLDIVLRVAMDVLEGLRYAHQLVGDDDAPLGIVHRDISPKNIVLGLDGGARLIDFGIARVEWSEHLTAPGAVLGTFSHAAPEQVTGGTVDARADLYSLGVVLFEMLTGQSLNPPAETTEMLRRITAEHPPALTSLDPGLPEPLERVLQRALEKRPEDRFPDAGSFLAALSSAAPNQETESRRRLRALLGQLFPATAQRFQAYELEAARGSQAALVVPSQLGEGPELTQAHTGLTELVGQKTSVDRTLVVRQRSAARPTPAPSRRRRRAWLVAAAPLLASIVVLGVLLARPRSAAPPPAPPATPRLEPASPEPPRAVSGAEPEAEAVEPEPEETPATTPAPPEPPPRAGVAERVRRRVEPSPQPRVPPAASAPVERGSKRQAKAEALGAKLRANPNDPDLFDAAARALEQAIDELPPQDRRPLRSRLQRAEVMNDARILLEALEALRQKAR